MKNGQGPVRLRASLMLRKRNMTIRITDITMYTLLNFILMFVFVDESFLYKMAGHQDSSRNVKMNLNNRAHVLLFVKPQVWKITCLAP